MVLIATVNTEGFVVPYEETVRQLYSRFDARSPRELIELNLKSRQPHADANYYFCAAGVMLPELRESYEAVLPRLTAERWPPIPAQDFSNLPRQQKGLHSQSFEHMRLSETMEGHISNFHRTIDGFLAGLPYEQLLPALREVNVNPLERPLVDLGL